MRRDPYTQNLLNHGCCPSAFWIASGPLYCDRPVDTDGRHLPPDKDDILVRCFPDHHRGGTWPDEWVWLDDGAHGTTGRPPNPEAGDRVALDTVAPSW